MYIGLTGNIASGKNSAASIFSESGCFCIDLDQISRDVMLKGNPVYTKVLEAFGNNILLDGGIIDRKELKEIIFNDPDKKKLLEEIVHPAIRDEENKRVKAIKATAISPIIIVHAALLVETGAYKRYDALIVIYTDENRCLERLIKRDGSSLEAAKKILKSQLPVEEKIKVANFIITNDGSLEKLKNEVLRVLNTLKIFQYTKRQLIKTYNIDQRYFKCT